MPGVICVPRLAQSLNEFVVVDILVELGNVISEGDEVVLVESDKAVHPIIADRGGCVSQILVAVGNRVVVDDRLLEVDGEPASSPRVEITEAKNQGWRFRRCLHGDLDECFAIWCSNQSVAVGDTSAEAKFRSLRDKFDAWVMLDESPFASFVCEDEQAKIVGWGLVQPAQRNPLVAAKIGTVSLYVIDPNAGDSPAVALLTHIIKHAETCEMGFLVGFSNRENSRAVALLQATGFRPLGEAGYNSTKLWCHDLSPGRK